MAKTKDEDFVTFLDSSGNVISNDPRYRAKKLLEQSGDLGEGNDDELREALDAADSRANQAEQEAESLKQQLAALQAQLAAGDSGVEDLGDEDDAEDEDDFTEMNGKELQAYAKENKLDIKGLKTVGEVRARLRELKAAE